MRTLVLVADDPAIVGRIRLATRYAAGVRVVASLDGRAIVGPDVAALEPDVVLVDAMCQRMNTLARLREVSAATRGASVVLLVSDRDRHVEQDAFAAGAHAVFNRDARAPALGTLIAEIAHGRLMLAPRVVAPHISSAPGGVSTAGAVVEHLRLVPDQEAWRSGASA